MHLTEDILDVTRIESNNLKISGEIINLNELISNVITDFVNGVGKNNDEKPMFILEYKFDKITGKDGEIKERSHQYKIKTDEKKY